MSSRSLAAARSRRAGDNIPPPVSGNRPGTSIGSHAAFAQQQNMQQQPSSNVRVVRGQPPQQYQQPKQPKQPMQQQQQYQQQQYQQQEPANNGLPFAKLTISDAIGLITLRLGRVEQWIIETDHEDGNHVNNNSFETNVPENSKIIDVSVLNSIFDRISSVENKTLGTNNDEQISKLTEEVSNLREQLTRIGDEGIRHNLAIAKHSEQLFKFERDLVETKDILKTFMIKYDLFTNETNDKFTDFETALSELEKSVLPVENEEGVVENQETDENLNDIDTNDSDSNNNVIMSVDLKNIIKQELASI